ncbi:MAG TPA: PEP/pyruvate-binding domain-containing protein, partial [Chloroflexota bacterium]|nr:PEP/pyruvate-binding domain-containing protein [Chloroflexota bacterium]
MSAVLDAAALIRPLDELDRYDLALAGGKAANLGELIRAGLPVPPGFCITTVAYRRLSQDAGLESVLEALAQTGPQDVPRLEELAAQAREGILAAPVPPEVAAAIARAYGALGATAVAVRSSATAEDLPDASFAGQQDTLLNILGEAAVLDAVRRCWASLWTDRAVIYRAGRGIDPRTVQLAVVVQQMVDAAVAGVLFTANPLTGRRREAAIDASPGLGEAVVSGAVTPDHFVVDLVSGEITERRLGHKGIRIEALPGGGTRRVAEPAPAAAQTPCLTDSQIRELARLGARVEEHFGQPQDVEWAVDAGGRVWLTQARPITTLYPLPAGAPPREAGLRVYFSFNVAQGVFRPLTPMGIQAFRTVSTGVARAVGVPVRDKDAGLGFLVEAGHRLYFDLTGVVRDAVGRRVIRQAFGLAEARSAAALEQLLADPRLAPAPQAPWRSAWRRVTALRRMMRLVRPRRAVRAWLDPHGTRQGLERVAAEALAMGDVPAGAGSAARLDAVERLLSDGAARIITSVMPVLPAGL